MIWDPCKIKTYYFLVVYPRWDASLRETIWLKRKQVCNCHRFVPFWVTRVALSCEEDLLTQARILFSHPEKPAKASKKYNSFCTLGHIGLGSYLAYPKMVLQKGENPFQVPIYLELRDLTLASDPVQGWAATVQYQQQDAPSPVSRCHYLQDNRKSTQSFVLTVILRHVAFWQELVTITPLDVTYLLSLV